VGPFQEFLSGAGRGLELLREAYALLRRARAKTEEARGQLLAATQGTGSAKADDSAGRLRDVSNILGEAGGHAVGGAEEFEAYLTLIGAESAVGSGTEGPFAPERPAGPDSLQLKDFRAAKKHDDAAERVRREVGWSDFNDDGSLRARGFMYDADGRPLIGGKILPASRRGPGADTGDLKSPTGRMSG